VSAAPFGTELGTPKPPLLRFPRRLECAEARFSSHDAKLFLVDFDLLGERAKVISVVASAHRPRMRLRAVLANVLRACGVIVGPHMRQKLLKTLGL
jgi:hypothetical protein